MPSLVRPLQDIMNTLGSTNQSIRQQLWTHVWKLSSLRLLCWLHVELIHRSVVEVVERMKKETTWGEDKDSSLTP